MFARTKSKSSTVVRCCKGPFTAYEDQSEPRKDLGTNLTVSTFDRQVVISFAALFTSSNGMRVAIEPNDLANWRDLLAAII